MIVASLMLEAAAVGEVGSWHWLAEDAATGFRGERDWRAMVGLAADVVPY